ncbi:MAG: BLUF domain-containing protein [Flavobacteriaceae bacterium]|nr:BLUF domain-containing protein [Flavobacteriaceae bacterium]
MIKYIAYVSRQSYILTDEDISALLVTCRTKNMRNEITGMLIYFDGTFIQFLEGPKENIDPLFDLISKDKRHQDVILLIDGVSSKREFEDWSMAFKKMTQPETAKILGQKDFKKEDLFKGKDPNTEHPGLLLIKSFVNNLHI